jgi:hypoxanthine-DNA glycosylase
MPEACGVNHARGFPPIANRTAETLILGSMPGQASLAARRYYAHPRNAFWPILCDLLELERDAPYPARVRALMRARIALWDVLASCERPGSLDARIRRDTLVPNDFAAFFRAHRRIRRIFFNGGTAERLFRRHVLPDLTAFGAELVRLPSTSPAWAGLPLAAKRDAWRVLVSGS